MKNYIIIGAIALIVIGGVVAFLLMRNSTEEITSLDKEVTQEEITIAEAQVNEIEIDVLESFPLQVRVVARGEFSDGCTEIHEVTQEKTEDIFFVKITTKRPTNAFCAQVIKSFEELVSLDIEGLEKGIYTVDVNGITDIFEIEFDNVAPKG